MKLLCWSCVVRAARKSDFVYYYFLFFSSLIPKRARIARIAPKNKFEQKHCVRFAVCFVPQFFAVCAFACCVRNRFWLWVIECGVCVAFLFGWPSNNYLPPPTTISGAEEHIEAKCQLCEKSCFLVKAELSDSIGEYNHQSAMRYISQQLCSKNEIGIPIECGAKCFVDFGKYVCCTRSGEV